LTSERITIIILLGGGPSVNIMGWIIRPKRMEGGQYVLPNRSLDYTFRMEDRDSGVVLAGLRVTRQLDAVIAPRSGNLGQYPVISIPPKMQEWILSEFKKLKEEGLLLKDPRGRDHP
jgi:hypothetical protein